MKSRATTQPRAGRKPDLSLSCPPNRAGTDGAACDLYLRTMSLLRWMHAEPDAAAASLRPTKVRDAR
jgi:hypothetical protein